MHVAKEISDIFISLTHTSSTSPTMSPPLLPRSLSISFLNGHLQHAHSVTAWSNWVELYNIKAVIGRELENMPAVIESLTWYFWCHLQPHELCCMCAISDVMHMWDVASRSKLSTHETEIKPYDVVIVCALIKSLQCDAVLYVNISWPPPVPMSTHT